MRAFLCRFGARPSQTLSGATPVATHGRDEERPLLVGQKRPRQCSSVASMLDLATGNSLRRRLSRSRLKYLRIALLARLPRSYFKHVKLTTFLVDRRQT